MSKMSFGVYIVNYEHSSLTVLLPIIEAVHLFDLFGFMPL